ncbi:MAG TPA: hypothetical protein VLI06_19960 [Solimonas sp.]|nr:hypothetical protein [Solimonas sp.]
MTDLIAQTYSLSVVLTLFACAALLWLLLYLDSAGFIRRRKQRLLRALSGTRLHAVMIRRRIVPAEYVERCDPASMAQQLDHCKSCEQTVRCDRTINSVAGDPPMAGCPNRAGILAACDARGLRAGGDGRR